MDYQPLIPFHPKKADGKKAEGIVAYLRRPSLGLRNKFNHGAQDEIALEKGETDQALIRRAITAIYDNNLELWRVFVHKITGFTIEGQEVSPERTYTDGPEDMVGEITAEILRLNRPVSPTEDADVAMIEELRQQIREIEKRIEARKNSRPQPSIAGSDQPSTTAAPVSAMTA